MPLTWISLAIDYHFRGPNTIGHHLTNCLLNGLNNGLVVLIAASDWSQIHGVGWKAIYLMQTLKDMIAGKRFIPVCYCCGYYGEYFHRIPRFIQPCIWGTDQIAGSQITQLVVVQGAR